MAEDDKVPREIIEATSKLRAEEFSRHYRMRAMIDDIEQAMGRTVRKVRNEGIVPISRHDAQNWLQSTTVDVFKYLENDMSRRGRPYIKCVLWDYNMILVSVPNAAYTQGLVTQLLFAAVVNPNQLNTKKKWTFQRVPLQVWKSPKTDTFMFYGDDGMKLFNEWKEFVTTDKASRARLGLSGAKNA